MILEGDTARRPFSLEARYEATVNVTDNVGRAMLHVVESANVLNIDFDLNNRDVLARSRASHMVTRLLRLGANCNQSTFDSNTPPRCLISRLARSHRALQAAMILLEHGTDPNIPVDTIALCHALSFPQSDQHPGKSRIQHRRRGQKRSHIATLWCQQLPNDTWVPSNRGCQ